MDGRERRGVVAAEDEREVVGCAVMLTTGLPEELTVVEVVADMVGVRKRRRKKKRKGKKERLEGGRRRNGSEG